MEETRKLIEKILEKGYLLSLATIDDGGLWVSDVIYVHDSDLNIYWLSQTNTRHSQAILKDNRVAGSITISNNPDENEIGLQLEGTAEKVNGDVFKMAVKHRQKRRKPEPTQEDEILDEGESWYRMKPSKIELLYQPLFGFEKRGIEL